MISTIIICASLVPYDGDSVYCSGRLMRLLGSGVVGVHGIDTPELKNYKCAEERRRAVLAKGRLAELLQEKGLRVEVRGYDKTPSRRPLINIYRSNGREIGRQLMEEGFAREWRKGKRNDWCK